MKLHAIAILRCALPGALFLTTLAGQSAAYADAGKPLWEAGLGMAALSIPAYRGAAQGKSYILPIPYFEYHGKLLKVDREGLRGQLFDSDRIDLNFSGSLSPPVISQDVTVRAGMPDLRAVAEIGPQLEFLLWRLKDKGAQIKFELPVHGAFTLENTPQSAGWVIHPLLNFDSSSLGSWNLGLQAGVVYADRKQHGYYYNVAAGYATAQRPAYVAAGGYGGSEYRISISRRYKQFWFGAYLRYDNVAAARFADSPLVQRKENIAGGAALAWVFQKSTQWVEEDE